MDSACVYQPWQVKKFLFMPPVKALFFSVIIFLNSCSQPSPAEKYGFITKLGNDTISVESLSRHGNRLTSEEVDRFPRVRVRHTVIDLDNDGSIRHLEMNIFTPSEPENERNRQVVADVARNKVHITKTDNSGTVIRDFPTDGSIVVAHVPQMYSLYELYFEAAEKQAGAKKLPAGTPVQLRQFYIDREFDRFPLGHATVTPLGNGKAKIYHDWLSGTGVAIVDSNFHLINYSGEGTTYKVHVTRVATTPDVKSIAERFESIEANSGNVKPLSVRDTVKSKIGDAGFIVDYSRPLQRGRKLLGDVIPYDRNWRTGANAATQFSTSVPIKLAGIDVPAGNYTLWTVPHTNGVDLIVNKQTGQWGTEFDASKNLGIAAMTTDSLSAPVEEFTISIVPGRDSRHGALVMEWGSFKWTAAIEVK